MKLNIYVLLLIFLVILMYFQPSFLGNLCTNCFGKATLVLLIVFLAIQDIGLAILASVVLISSIHLVSREGFKEGNTGIAGICKRVNEDGTLKKISYNQSDCLINGTCHETGSNSYSEPSLGGDPSVLQSQCDGIGSCTKSDGSDLALQDRREKACLHRSGTCDNNNATTGADCDNSFTCSDPTYTDKATCEGAGKCIDDNGDQVSGITTKPECDAADNATWTPNTYSPSIWTSDNTWNDLQYEWKRHTWDVSTQPNLGCDSYQEHINDDNAHSIHQHVSGFRNRKGGKEGFMVSSSELISFEDSKIRGKDSNIYPVSRSNVQNKGLFSGFNLF